MTKYPPNERVEIQKRWDELGLTSDEIQYSIRESIKNILNKKTPTIEELSNSKNNTSNDGYGKILINVTDLKF